MITSARANREGTYSITDRSNSRYTTHRGLASLYQAVAATVGAAALVFAWPALAADSQAPTKISGPHVQDNLAVYFIHGQSRSGPVPLTLAEAMRNRSVTVHETGQVQQLLIENTGDREVFVQAGDIVKGGRQDRVLTISLLLPPKSGKISIGSYCVEQGRWSRRGGESAKRFSSADASMPSRAAKIAMFASRVRTVPTAQIVTGPNRPLSARLPEPTQSNARRILQDLEQRRAQSHRRIVSGRTRAPSNQQEVWRNIAEIQRKLSTNLATGIRSKTSASSLQLSLEHQKLIEARQKMAAALAPHGRNAKDIIGYAFAINGRINSAEIYPSNGLFAKMWPKLLKASVTEAIAEKDAKQSASKPPATAAVRAFLDEAAKGKPERSKLRAKLSRERRETRKALSLSTEQADGTVVHLSILARH